MTYKEMTEVGVYVGIGRPFSEEAKRTPRGKGWYRLTIWREGKKNPLLINMKPFSREDLCLVAKRIRENSNATLDKTVTELSEGHFEAVMGQFYKSVPQLVAWLLWMGGALGIANALWRYLHH